jgi:DNA processing protein
MIDVEEMAYWAVISDNQFLDLTDVEMLKEKHDSLSVLWKMSYDKIFDLMGNSSRAKFFYKIAKDRRLLQNYSRTLNAVKDKNIKITTIFDKDYPVKLKRINFPPLILYSEGKLENFEKCVAIVGSRNSSHFGHQVARTLSRYLAKKDYTIVSGLARGIDTEAHCGALDIEGKTIAVVPGDTRSIYPSENKELTIDIKNSGAIISGVSPMVKIERKRFVQRNRIISGLSNCLIVAESGGSMGTIHQVGFATKQKIKVFIPKPTDEKRSAFEGYKEIVKRGAISFTSYDEVLDYLKKGKLKDRDDTSEVKQKLTTLTSFL